MTISSQRLEHVCSNIIAAALTRFAHPSGIELAILRLNNLEIDLGYQFLLNKSEQSRFFAIKTPIHRQYFLARRLAVRCCVAEKYQIHPGEVGVYADEVGRLRIQANKAHGLYLGLSESGGVALLAHGVMPLGVDIEARREVKNFAAIAKRYGLGTDIHNSDDFLGQWTLFEARAKANGQGIAKYTAQPQPVCSWPVENLELRAVLSYPSHVAAVCWQPGDG
jgi:phosphopantetheinyl transferase